MKQNNAIICLSSFKLDILDKKDLFILILKKQDLAFEYERFCSVAEYFYINIYCFRKWRETPWEIRISNISVKVHVNRTPWNTTWEYFMGTLHGNTRYGNTTWEHTIWEHYMGTHDMGTVWSESVSIWQKIKFFVSEKY